MKPRDYQVAAAVLRAHGFAGTVPSAATLTQVFTECIRTSSVRRLARWGVQSPRSDGHVWFSNVSPRSQSGR